jgi:hypothetical protein
MANSAMPTRDEAGLLAPKYAFRTSFTMGRSSQRARNTVTLTTSSRVAPAAASARFMLSSTCRVWATTSPAPTRTPWRSMLAWPET